MKNLFMDFFKTLAVILTALAAMEPTPAWADVAYTHEYKTSEYLLGEQDAVLSVAFSGNRMFVDKRTRLTGSFMKRFFGKVKENRETAMFFLDEDRILTVDWQEKRVIETPLVKLEDAREPGKDDEFRRQARELVSARYTPVKPEFRFHVSPDLEQVGKYLCSRVTAEVILKTMDRKKNACSITELRQVIWVSTDVPGALEYDEFHGMLAERMGLNALVLGKFSYLLENIQTPPPALRKKMAQVKGFPVKSRLTIDASYERSLKNGEQETSHMAIKKEETRLTGVRTTGVDTAVFYPDSSFYGASLE